MSVADVHLRPATPADVDAIIAWESDADARPWLGPIGRTWHEDALAAASQRSFIASVGHSPVGFAVLARIADPSVELRRIVVAPASRGAGIGRALLSAVLTWIGSQTSATQVWLDVKRDNERARSLYAAAGFEVARSVGEVVFMERPVGDR